jgi:hypothetical protein
MNPIGMDISKESTLVSHGSSTQPNVFTDVQYVQEATQMPVWCLFLLDRPTPYPPDAHDKAPPKLDFQFSNFHADNGWYHLLSGDFETWSSAMNLSFRDCQLFNGWFWVGIEPDYAIPACGLSFVNSHFDRVLFNLDPDWGTWLDLDMSLHAYNNLFRGGAMNLVPIAPTAGSWSFKDNLFDKVEFIQDTLLPIEHNNNGYWPLLTSELQWAGGTVRLSPNGSQDKLLTSSPAYQSGPSGGYYLATTSPLWNAGIQEYTVILLSPVLDSSDGGNSYDSHRSPRV